MLVFGLAALSGVLCAVAYPGIGWWPLAWLQFVPLLLALDRPLSLRRALAIGLTFGVIAHLVACPWVFVTLLEFAQLSWPLAAAAGFLLAVWQGGSYALFALLCWGSKRRGLDLAWVAPCALIVVEAAYPALFPAYAGAAVWPLAALQVGDLGGPWLVSALLMTGNAGLFAAGRAAVGVAAGTELPRAVFRPLMLAAAVLGCALVYGVVRMAGVRVSIAAASKISVAVVQAEQPPVRRLDQHGEVRRAYVEQSKQLTAPPDLLVWPETSLHYVLAADTKSVRQALGPLATPVLFGGLTQSPSGDLYNSAYLASATGRVLGRADKQKLIPFSEYVPLRRAIPAMDRWLPNSGQFVAGTDFRGLSLGRHRIAALLCYEDLLPRFARTMVDRTAAQLLVSLSNDVWFGRGTATHIHEGLARLRAIEQRRYLVRANNSGVSAVIDANGAFVARTRPFTRQNLRAEVAMLDGASGFARGGDLCAWLAGALLVLAWATSRRTSVH